ncbi:MAG: hypothetical protein H7829_13680 [Magnetococcus sp. THC-1_WYH]
MSTHPRKQSLPALREELAIFPGPLDSLDGKPTGIIHDAVRHRFYRIGLRELVILQHWQGGDTLATLHARLNQANHGPIPNVSLEEIAFLADFLKNNQLVQHTQQPLVSPPQPSWLRTLLTHYLYIRIPLLTPDRWLQRLVPWTQFFDAPAGTALFWLLVLAAWFMTMQQMDRFIDAIPEVFDTQGAMILAVAVFLAKAVHELGHALTAKRSGLNVPTMGIAFLVLWPVLYTELSETWKLSSKTERLAIAKGGIQAELMLAVWATVLWNLWPDGNIREALFLLATTTWIVTLTINTSPFMRFDGYFLLSDWLDIPNLHPRAFAMGRWWLRCRLLGVSLPPPEPWSLGKRWFLISFAYATWIYRVILFVTIAWLVYHFFFKILGLILLGVELTWFVIRPIGAEIREWGAVMRGASWGAVVPRLGGWLVVGMGLLFYPWSVDVEMAALLRPERLLAIYPPQEGQIDQVYVVPGQFVRQGERMVRLDAPELNLKLHLSQARRMVFQRRLDLSSTSLENLENQASLSQQLAQEMVRLEGLRDQREKLVMTAPMAGRVVTVMDHLHEGRWVGTKQPLLTLAAPVWQVQGYVGEADLQNMVLGSRGWFYSAMLEIPAIEVRLSSVVLADSQKIDLPELASIHGGGIPSAHASDGQIVAKVPVYRSVMTVMGTVPEGLERIHRGTVRIRGGRESAWDAFFQWVASHLIRESGF